MLKIGISACFFHAEPQRPVFTGKPLQYIEQEMAHGVMRAEAMALMIPSPDGATRRPVSRVTVHNRGDRSFFDDITLLVAFLATAEAP